MNATQESIGVYTLYTKLGYSL